MNYKQFSNKLIGDILGTQICERSEFLGHTIALSESNEIYIDNTLTGFSSVQEAKDHITQEQFEEEIAQEIYEEIPNIRIANIIREHHNIKVTDTLIESYLDLAFAKTFTTDPVVSEIRSLNSVDSILNNKIDFVLKDGSTVAIDEDTHSKLSNLIDDKYKLIDYMRESKSNFVRVVKELS